MSWYQTPVQPFDPVVVSQTPKPPIRYMRDNFANTGQHSYVKAPAQDQAMWQSLLNVQPITQGILNQRWGYNLLNLAYSAGAVRLYNFQSDSLGQRAIVLTAANSVSALKEDGTSYNLVIFYPSAGGNVIRSVTSRNYQYFCDGNNALNPTTHRTGDSLKWDGSPTLLTGTSNIGILNTDVTQNNVAGGGSTFTYVQGPNTGGTVTDIAAAPVDQWINPSGIFSNNPATPAKNGIGYFPITQTTTDSLKALQFFGPINVGQNVQGIQVAFTYTNTYTNGGSNGFATIFAQLIKNGVKYGAVRQLPLAIDGTSHVATLGSPNDVWGGNFVPSDLSGNTFGVQFYVSGGLHNPNGTQGFTIAIQFVTITATLNTTISITNSSAAGVGIAGAEPGGSVNLSLGRTYYLVGNNSLTGHFSDLTTASASTGSGTNAEYNLALATFNDPQVDKKFVLATADGGDPSILYETLVLVPGLTVSSWAIDGANHVTFTGIYTGNAPANGATVVVGGLNHGNYLNGATLTVTGTTGTTLTANFTHGADSATEIGVVGNYGFEIPNSVTLVIDNTPDPNLVTYQPLLFTDQFGNSFGVALNTPPPAGNIIVKHQGRLWMAGIPGATHSVYFSKAVAELTLPNGFIAGKYEEAWPLSNYFDVSDGAESVSGLLSDGNTLYIGTQNHVRRLLGNAPANFQEPQIVHPQVGVMNQEVWQTVFLQGTPAGCIWMTPDFRVIQSDFNTYVDIGNPIQDILNNLQPTAQSLAHAAFVADGEYNLYILAVPYLQSTYCDTHLVFDLKARQWFVWQPANGSVSLLYNVTQAGIPQWLFVSGVGNFFSEGITSLTRSSNVVTALLLSKPLIAVGASITVSGASDASYNGTFSVTSITAFFTGPHTLNYNVTWNQTGANSSTTGGLLTSNVQQNVPVNIYSPTATTDNGIAIPVSATTTWLHLGEPTRRKMLNEVQVYGNTTMTMSVNGSNNLQDFLSTPRPIVYNRTLIQSPFGTWNLYLTGVKTRHRYYQFTFQANNGLIPFLGSFAIAAAALDDL
jgi:hypothetical protein